jgi:hypothetical protein
MAVLRGSAEGSLIDMGDPLREFINLGLTSPRVIQDNEVRPFLKNLFLKEYGYNILTEGALVLAKVEEVLSGPNSKISPSADGKREATTTMENTGAASSPGDRRVRVKARTFLDPVGQPKNDDDHIRKSSLGEYVATSPIDIDGKFNQIRVGTDIWVRMRGTNPSPSDGGPAGYIIGVHSNPKLIDRIVKALSAKTVLFPGCKPDIQFAGPIKNNLVGNTKADPNIATPPIRKHKIKIKTGLFGNGTNPTKMHFNEALRKANDGFNYITPGPAPDKNSAFIWIGHLRNNGYLDLLDRPVSLGRETIIYAPMTLNPYAPIEIKYYFHDRGGFGHAWVRGPATDTFDALSIPETGNDFKEKIAPAIKDMIRDKRNFILVIPEMSFSRGFGTRTNDSARIEKMSRGRGVQEGSVSSTDITMRTAIHPDARPIVKKYLINLPASKITEYKNGFLDMVSNDVALENILQKTFLKERETATFDGSFTGGKFGDFHTEVLQVIADHLGQNFVENINYTSILADGYGAISLASIVRSMPFSSVHTAAESSFRSVNIDRIDYVESGLSIKNAFSFSDSPAYSIFSEYLLPKTNSPFPFTFNYIIEGGSSGGDLIAARTFFNKIKAKSQFDKHKGVAAGKGSEKFTVPVKNNSNVVISLHTTPSTNNGATHKKVGYAFNIKPSYLESQNNTISVPESTISVIPSYNLVPNHAAAAASGISEGKAKQHAKEKEEIKKILVEKDITLRNYVNLNDVAFCDLYSGLCMEVYDGVLAKNLRKITPYFIDYVEKLEKYYELNELERLEIDLSKLKGKLNPMRDYLDNAREIYKTLVFKNTSNQKFAETFPNYSFSFALKLGTDNLNFTFRKASQILRSANDLALISSGGDEHFGGSFTNKKGIYRKIAYSIGLEKAYAQIIASIENEIENYTALESKPPLEGCAVQPISIRRVSDINSPFVFNPDRMRASKQGCPERIRVVSSASELYDLIPWKPEINQLKPSESEKISRKQTSLEDVSEFQAGSFRYKARGPQNTTVYKKSPNIWSCITDKISEGWDAACNVSGYVPFMVTGGIRGFLDKQNNVYTNPLGITAYHSGLDIGTYGLSFSVDAPIAAYKGDLEPVYSVFTGMWTAGFVEAHTEELYQLGVLKYDPTPFGSLNDAGSLYKDNAYQGYFEKDLRQAENWKDAEDSYLSDSVRIDDYDRKMKLANGSFIVPPGADPVQWLLTFCERTGMRWGNSFFLRKRYRGAKSGLTIFGFDVRNDTPAFWSDAEQKRIAAIYGIDDVVARINAISIPQVSYDNHMHFQYYSGAPVIPWSEIQKVNKI